MKSICILVMFCFTAVLSFAQNNKMNPAVPDSSKKILTVEASCGECRFQMGGTGCNLAVRIKGKTYFVDGTSINDHGDAHAPDGFCQAIRMAKVQGEIVKNRFKATYFQLIIPEDKKQ